MKIEIGKTIPDNFKKKYPEQFEVFSHMECVAAIPHVLFAVTTIKENGQPNVNFHSWSCFQGDGTGFYAILAGIYQHTHTYANIKRTKDFCVNFLPLKYCDQLLQTIEQNGDCDNEFEVGKFAIEKSCCIEAPRIKESFLSLECKATQISDLSGGGVTAMIVGEVQNIAVDSAFASGDSRYNRYGENGFMYLIHAPQDLVSGDCGENAAAILDIKRPLD